MHRLNFAEFLSPTKQVITLPQIIFTNVLYNDSHRDIK